MTDIATRLMAIVDSAVREHPPQNVGFVGVEMFEYPKGGIQLPEYWHHDICLIAKPLTAPIARPLIELRERIEAAVRATLPECSFWVQWAEPDEFSRYQAVTTAARDVRAAEMKDIAFTEITVPISRRYPGGFEDSRVSMNAAKTADIPSGARMAEVCAAIRKLAVERGFPADQAEKIHFGWDSQEAEEQRRNDGWYS